MKKLLTYKNLLILMVIGFIISMIPVFVMASYTLPYYDDYDYGFLTHQAWNQTGSFAAVLKAAAQQVSLSYESWQGTFTGIFFMALNPGIYSDSLYPLGIYLLILLFCGSVLIFLKVALRNCLGMEKYPAAIISMGMLILIFQFMVSRSEGLFWFNGGFYYTGFYAFALLMFSALLYSAKSERRIYPWIAGAFAPVFALLVGGSNYTCALTAGFALGIFTVYRWVFDRKHAALSSISLAVLLAALVINAMAPGNQVRQANFESPGAVRAIIYSLIYGLQFISKYIGLPVILGLLILLPQIYRGAEKSRLTFAMPGVLSMVSYFVFASSFTPSFYALNKIGPPRTLNISFFTLMLLLLFNIYYWCGWICKIAGAKLRFSSKKKAARIKTALPLCLVMGFLAITLGMGLENPNSVTSIGALRSLYNGEVTTFHDENIRLIEALKEPGVQNVVVKPYSVKPFFYYQSNLSEDPETLLNRCTAKYYGKESVVVRYDLQ